MNHPHKPYAHTILCAGIFAALSLTFCSCQESMEQKALREAREYTRRYCPTPVINNSRTDSITFDPTHRLFTYYFTFVDAMDDAELIQEHQAELVEILTNSVRESTSMKQYVEAGYKFRYVCHSQKNPKVVLLQTNIK